jgi:Protein of unknown function (DUF3572)
MAVEALTWLAQNSARLERFLAISGLGPQNLRQAAAEPAFLAAILDYLAADESLLVSFCEATNRPPESVGEAQSRLRLGRSGVDS